MSSAAAGVLAVASVTVLAICMAAPAAAFAPSLMGASGEMGRCTLRAGARRDTVTPLRVSMSTQAAEKPGTGQNRMTQTGFTVPFVEKVTVPSSHGVEWKVKEDVLDSKKLNMQEKVKLAKPGLSIIDELEKLAAEAKEKGGAQVICFLPAHGTL